jgi:hypothetical protein
MSGVKLSLSQSQIQKFDITSQCAGANARHIWLCYGEENGF